MTDTKPTLENTDEICKWVLHYYGYQPANMSQPEQWLYKLAWELQAIRSAELPVEPDMKWLRGFINSVPFLPGIPKDDIKKAHEIIDALKSYALKEKERADWYEKRKACAALEQDEVGAPCGYLRDMTDRAEKAESELAALRGRLMEPSEEMIEAGYPPNDESAQSWGVVEVFKAMSAVSLKEGK